ncbi:MAG: hypothetical protein NWR77_05040 [Burkholderiaceae bacterium]|jgi:hypothetical protein|nr:hypothetical protein [Pseudomonadota bacterium]MDA1186386.1 hypothetical protein [Pseudomonadota bacterium]MDP4829460.1 hypothetical protein [Burkholderiaceae bacterium]MDP4950059.1 hypothetical protein [Burkholderiaceae bacterium]
MKEWLLIVWIGTTTNFTVMERHLSEESCNQSAEKLKATTDPKFTVECSSDLREGRSQLPKPFGSGGGVGGK